MAHQSGRRRQAALFLGIVALGALSSAQALPGVVSLIKPGRLAELRTQGSAVRAVSGEEAAEALLLPNHASSEIVRDKLAKKRPSVLVEALFFLERPQTGDPGAEFLAAYNILRRPSSLEGIQYWSASRGTWRTFYAESYRIDDAARRQRLPDPGAVKAFPSEEELLVFQRDLTFGPTVYRYTYSAKSQAGQSSAVIVSQTNLSKMSYGPIPVFSPEGLETNLLIIQCAEGFLFYALSAAEVPVIPGLRGKLEDSFSNRAAALFRWFSSAIAAR